MKFKVHDKVKILKSGAEAKVISLNARQPYSVLCYENGVSWWYREDELEAVPPVPPRDSMHELKELAWETAGQLTTIGVLAKESSPEYGELFAPIILAALEKAISRKEKRSE